MLWLLASSLAYLNAARSSRVNRSVSVSLRPKRYRSICLSLRDIDLTATRDMANMGREMWAARRMATTERGGGGRGRGGGAKRTAARGRAELLPS